MNDRLKPPGEFNETGSSRPSTPAQLAYDSEDRTTRQICDLVDLAAEEKNHITSNFLQWFVAEQLEEMASADKRLTVIKRSGPNLLMIEAYLAHGEAISQSQGDIPRSSRHQSCFSPPPCGRGEKW